MATGTNLKCIIVSGNIGSISGGPSVSIRRLILLTATALFLLPAAPGDKQTAVAMAREVRVVLQISQLGLNTVTYNGGAGSGVMATQW